ncbi:MAG: YeeE/YedE family protein, partial [Litorivicinaceae bacterium]
ILFPALIERCAAMTEFTPIPSLLGGLLIGLSAAVVFVFFGRILGISGIVARTLNFDFGSGLWRPLFLIGLVVSPVVLSMIAPSPHGFEPMGLIPMMIGGFLVGYGTRVGSGCTSGHGICGISRLSKRSIVATCTFMTAAVMTVFVVRHLFESAL